jgi:hypothetical protein
VHVEHVQDIVVFEEFEEPAQLGCGGVHRGAIEHASAALHLKPRSRFLKQHDREDFLGDTSGRLAVGEARDERHCGCEGVEREALVNRRSERGRDDVTRVLHAAAGEQGGAKLVDEDDAAVKQGAPRVQVIDDAGQERQGGRVDVAG